MSSFPQNMSVFNRPLTFDETGFQPQSDQNGVQVWYTPQGDGLGLFHFKIPPDIEANIDDVQSVRAYYRKLVGPSNETVGIIEIDTIQIDGCQAIRTLLKSGTAPVGRTYLGSLTFPFRDFSLVLKVQCAERGMTGLRETIVLDQFLGSGTVQLASDSGAPVGWLEDLYDPEESGPMTRNRSERVEYDVEFPDHPLSRARQILSHLERSVTVSSTVRGAPRFVWNKSR